jgi:hypothetical protein
MLVVGVVLAFWALSGREIHWAAGLVLLAFMTLCAVVGAISWLVWLAVRRRGDQRSPGRPRDPYP